MALAAVHPGEHLTEGRKALDMSAAELARGIDVPTNRTTQILNGTQHHGRHRPAPGSSLFFGRSAQFWLNLQSLYNLRLAQEKAGSSLKALAKLKRGELVRP